MLPANRSHFFLAYRMDCGDDDFLTKEVACCKLRYRTSGFDMTIVSAMGAHSWTYWGTGIIPALAFLVMDFIRSDQ